MSSTPTLPTPIFYEALAEAAHCTPVDAYEHFQATAYANARGQRHPVEAFLEDYAVMNA